MRTSSLPHPPERPAFYRIGAFVVSLLLIALIILISGASPVTVIGSMIGGAFGNPDQIGRVFATLSPLLLCSAGLVFTFNAGLYNLGIEGQITVGAIAATFVLRLVFPEGATASLLPPPIAIGLAILAGSIGGVLWGLLAGALHVYGRISEIFAGLGLNFAATGLAIYLIFGPWKRPGVASLSGTQPFDVSLWLGAFAKADGQPTDATPVALILALIALIVTIIVMRRTYFGLRLRAVGKNLRASYVLGIPARRQLLSAFAICGLLAGVAGALQVVGLFHRLIPNISSNLGFLALLVVMLVNFDPLWILPVAFFFSALNVGSLQLPLSLSLESSLSGVIQGLLVLFALLGRGLAQKYGRRT
jgi:simple sugar transport system permease protein